MKNGIILAGGTGTRLFPLNQVVNKHLLGIDGKFIIDYPLNTLKEMGCENVTVILGGNHFSQVVDHLKDGRDHGMKFNYVYQGTASGIAQAINLCQRFVEDDEQFAVILGDNIYENPVLWNDIEDKQCAQIALYEHTDLHRFGVASFDKHNKIINIEEKPKIIDSTLSNLAITGCYLFTHEYFKFFKDIQPSARGEYEITDIIKKYVKQGNISYTKVDGLWSDAGTHESIEYLNNYFYRRKYGTA